MKQNKKTFIRRKEKKRTGFRKKKMAIIVALKCLKITDGRKARNFKRVSRERSARKNTFSVEFTVRSN